METSKSALTKSFWIDFGVTRSQASLTVVTQSNWLTGCPSPAVPLRIHFTCSLIFTLLSSFSPWKFNTLYKYKNLHLFLEQQLSPDHTVASTRHILVGKLDFYIFFDHVRVQCLSGEEPGIDFFALFRVKPYIKPSVAGGHIHPRPLLIFERPFSTM